jgi:hypothetical protein
LKDEDNENFRMVGVQWWVSMNKGTNLDEWGLLEWQVEM